jgi:RNA polymerase sigma-70 factor (ECF subfamily)
MPDSQSKTWDDAPIVKQAKAGNTEAFGQLYDHYAPIIFRFVYAQLPDRMEAEDLTAEVFMNAWHSLAKYQERGFAFSAFLFRIARNQIADFYRKNKRRAIVDSEIIGKISEDGRSIPKAFVEKQEHQELYQKLSMLKADYRTVLTLRFLNELSPKETAQVMKRSEGAVRVLQHRALSALKKLVDNHEPKEEI